MTEIYFIIPLLPLVAFMLVFQTNPYNALIKRGALGAVAAMLYAILGAPDVALTEALVGTMLAVTLFAIAIRSSLVMRLGVIEEKTIEPELEALEPVAVAVGTAVDGEASQSHLLTQASDSVDPAFANPSKESFRQTVTDLRILLKKHYMRLELVPYDSPQALDRALADREVHAICVENDGSHPSRSDLRYKTITRIHRLYELLTEDRSLSQSLDLHYVNVLSQPTVQGDKH